MSRIGKKTITIPSGVTVQVTPDTIEVAGTKGKLTVNRLASISIEVDDGIVAVKRLSDEKKVRAFHGLQRSLIYNAVVGVSEGFTKTLKLVGTGYRVKSQGKSVELSVGYSHPVVVAAPEGINLVVEGTDTIKVSGCDKQAVGEIAANIRKVRPPEPYKGKGIRYDDEVVRRKQGKAAA